MLNQISKKLFIAVSIFCFFNQALAMKRAGQPYVGRWIRPNAKSSLRYFSVSPDRTCRTTTHITPTRKTFASKRDLSLGQISSNLWKKARWSLTSHEEKQNELFDALEDNILTRNADESLSSIVGFFRSEDLLNTPKNDSHAYFNLTPLEFAIKKSRHTNPEYQRELTEAFIKNKSEGLAKALYYALEKYNEGAVSALVHAVNPLVLRDFFTLVQKNVEKEQTALDDIISSIREDTTQADLPGQAGLIKLRLELMGKIYANKAKLKRILNLKKEFKELRDLESVFLEKEEASL
jgi:hypothetical protein